MTNDAAAWSMETSLGSWNPLGCLVSVIDDPTEATQAVDALRAAGFAAEDVHLLLAAEVLASANPHQSILARVFFALANLSDDAAFEATYREEAEHGHQIVVVYAPTREQVEQAHLVVERYHAHTLLHYGPWVVRGIS